MRASQNENDFCQFLLSIGDGNYPICQPPFSIELPSNIILKNNENIIDSVYGTSKPIEVSILKKLAILGPKNLHCDEINNKILNELPSQLKSYKSINWINFFVT